MIKQKLSVRLKYLWFRTKAKANKLYCHLTGKNIWLSFVEEMMMNPKFRDYVGGRVEVWNRKSTNGWAEREIRFFAPRTDEWYAFRDKWDFRDITPDQLKEIEQIIEDNFNYDWMLR